MTPNERALSDEVDLIIGDMVERIEAFRAPDPGPMDDLVLADSLFERFADYLLAGGRPVQDLLSMVAGVAARRE